MLLFFMIILSKQRDGEDILHIQCCIYKSAILTNSAHIHPYSFCNPVDAVSSLKNLYFWPDIVKAKRIFFLLKQENNYIWLFQI